MFGLDWFWTLCIVLAAVFTILPAVLYFGGDETAAQKVFFGFWGSVIALTIITLTMTFIVKPVLAWFFGLF